MGTSRVRKIKQRKVWIIRLCFFLSTELPEPASKRIDWAKGPTYYNKIRSTLRPAYYPGKTETSFEPIKRNYEYGNSFIDKPVPTSGYNTLRGYTSPPNYDSNRQVKPIIYITISTFMSDRLSVVPSQYTLQFFSL